MKFFARRMRLKKRSVLWKCFLYVVVIHIGFVLMSFIIDDTDMPVEDQRTDFVRTFSARTIRNNSRKTILAWTSFWFKDYWCDMSMTSVEVSRCSDRCDVTTDKSRLEESDVVLFHLPDLLPWTPLPRRKSEQIWVLYNLEPPPRQIWYTGGAAWRNVFNWTLTYRQDSTVFVRPYHGYEPLSAEEKVKVNGNSVNFLANKTKLAIATISDCYDDAGRYKDIEELKKYIDIDIYGKCGTKQCNQWSKECEKTTREYKFHLAFENAYCKDYITEKYWEAHMRKMIPVVNWKTDPNGLVFPKSYINIFDFPDMKAVADYMIKVGNDEALYNSYFDWTKQYKMNCHCGCHWCALCDAVHDPKIPAQVITDPMKWASLDSCQIFSVGINACAVKSHMCSYITMLEGQNISCMFTQRRLRSACASVESDQSLPGPFVGSQGPNASTGG